MKALILAAGQGTRLKKYTQDLPKGMLQFNGKTVIEHQLDLYTKCGIDDIIIVKGYAADKINYKGVKYFTNQDFAATNMVMSLLTARSELNDDIIVSYSDILFQEQMLQKMIAAQHDYCVAVDDNWKEYWMLRYGCIDTDTESLVIDNDDNITTLGCENPALDMIDARYIGLLKFTKKALANILDIWDAAYEEYSDKPWQQSGKAIKQAYMTDLLNALIQASCEVKAIHFTNGWIEFDTNNDYELACKWLKDGTMSRIINIVKQ